MCGGVLIYFLHWYSKSWRELERNNLRNENRDTLPLKHPALRPTTGSGHTENPAPKSFFFFFGPSKYNHNSKLPQSGTSNGKSWSLHRSYVGINVSRRIFWFSSPFTDNAGNPTLKENCCSFQVVRLTFETTLQQVCVMEALGHFPDSQYCCKKLCQLHRWDLRFRDEWPLSGHLH